MMTNQIKLILFSFAENQNLLKVVAYWQLTLFNTEFTFQCNIRQKKDGLKKIIIIKKKKKKKKKKTITKRSSGSTYNMRRRFKNKNKINTLKFKHHI